MSKRFNYVETWSALSNSILPKVVVLKTTTCNTLNLISYQSTVKLRLFRLYLIHLIAEGRTKIHTILLFLLLKLNHLNYTFTQSHSYLLVTI